MSLVLTVILFLFLAGAAVLTGLGIDMYSEIREERKLRSEEA